MEIPSELPSIHRRQSQFHSPLPFLVKLPLLTWIIGVLLSDPPVITSSPVKPVAGNVKIIMILNHVYPAIRENGNHAVYTQKMAIM
ncbi:hypothetical protein SDJN03_13827, partial [Cucurbita argyrosperma subsp. sororia]